MFENWCHILILIFQDFGSHSGYYGDLRLLAAWRGAVIWTTLYCYRWQ